MKETSPLVTESLLQTLHNAIQITQKEVQEIDAKIASMRKEAVELAKKQESLNRDVGALERAAKRIVEMKNLVTTEKSSTIVPLVRTTCAEYGCSVIVRESGSYCSVHSKPPMKT